jgi:2OG-Fe(II) oxygenase superfamily
MNLFKWSTFDVRTLLPAGWNRDLVEAAIRLNRRKRIAPPHVTSREAADVPELVIRGVGSQTVEHELPWIFELYNSTFRDLAQRTTDEQVSVAQGARHTVALNVQAPGDMRYECHVDTNPIQGLLYVTTHPEGEGGELIVSNNPNANCVEDIDADCSIIYPQSGHLLFFDGRQNPHYIRPLLRQDSIRVAVAMNYYVPSVPESLRPHDLDDYLFGTVIE